MSFLIDLIVLAIIVFIIITSAKKGFVFLAIEVVGFIAAISLSMTLSANLADVTYTKYVEPTILSSVSDATHETTENTTANLWDSLPDFIKNNAKDFGINEEMLTQDITGEIGEDAAEMIEKLINDTVKPMALKILESLFYIILLSVFMVVVKFLAQIVSKFVKFSLIGKINTILGGLLGCAKGVIVASVLCTAVCLLLTLFKDGIWIFTNENIDKTYLFKLLSNLIKF